jgi:hypothetical protein
MWLRDLGAEGFPCANFGALGRAHPSNKGLVIFRHILMLFFLTSGVAKPAWFSSLFTYFLFSYT